MKQEFITADEFKYAKEYWMEKLKGEYEEVCLYSDFTRTLEYKPEEHYFTLSSEISERLSKISRNQDVLLYVFLASAVMILLYKLTGKENMIIGSPAYTDAGEEYHGYNHCIPLKEKINGEMTFKQLLVNVRGTVTDSYKNQHYSIGGAMELLGMGSSLKALYRNIVALETIHGIKAINNIISAYQSDLIIVNLKTGKGLEGRIIYNSKIFKRNTVEELSRCYIYILEQINKSIDIKLSDIKFADERTEEELKAAQNMCMPAAEETVVDRFERQVAGTPENIAVAAVFDSSENATGKLAYKSLSYRELDYKADCLAQELRRRGVKSGSIVGLLIDASLELAVGIWGILKAGGAYLPLDTEYPQDRISHMLRDSMANVLVTNETYNKIIGFEGQMVLIDDEEIYNPNGALKWEKNRVSPEDPVYVIYTSGSTGQPKGVVIAHKSLINFIDWRIKEYGFEEKDVTLQLLSPAFDGYGTNFYSGLLSGGTLVVPDNRHWRNISYIVDIIRYMKVTNTSIVPSLLKVILDNAGVDDLRSLKFIILAAENADKKLIEESIRKMPGVLLINEYGPTENCITATYFMGMTPDKVNIIGKPIKNVSVMILNSDNNIMPAGFRGELCISGIGLATGYLNSPLLNQKKFVPNPYNPDQVMYRTGDSARVLEDGNIEFLGRIDNQVKIRGLRIELGEIEILLKENPDVKSAAVISSEDNAGNTQLYAFIEARDELDSDSVKEELKRKIPEYMVPNRIIRLEKIPLTLNGKVDKKALIEIKDSLDLAEYKKPQNKTEEKIAEIWGNVLGADKRIGVNSNFFDIGGNSILLMQVHKLFEKEFPGQVSIPDLFAFPTVSRLAGFMEAKGNIKLKDRLSIEAVDLGSGYFSNKNGRNKTTALKFNVPPDLKEKIGKLAFAEDMEVAEALFYTYAYLLSQMSQGKDGVIYAALRKKNVFSPVSINNQDINNFSELFKKLKDRYNSTSEKTAIDAGEAGCMACDRNGYGAAILFYAKGLLNGEGLELQNAFDIIMEADVSQAEIICKCDFNSGRLNRDKIEEHLNRYVKLLGYILKEYN